MITRNPFGVGASGERREWRTGRCTCCGLGYQYEWWPGGQPEQHCAPCRAHTTDLGDRQAQALARLSDHEPRIRAYADHASKRATEYELLAKRAKADGASQAASAFRQRDLYRQQLAEVYRLHVEGQGRCKNCSARYPCATIRLLEGGPHGTGDAIVAEAARRDDLANPPFDW